MLNSAFSKRHERPLLYPKSDYISIMGFFVRAHFKTLNEGYERCGARATFFVCSTAGQKCVMKAVIPSDICLVWLVGW